MLDFGAIFAAILGSAGLFSLIQFFVNRHDHKVNDFTIIKKELKGLKKSQENTNTRVTRMELMSLMRNDSENIDAILQVAEYYFIELDGNAYAHAVFEDWAVKHGVAIGWLPKLKKGAKYGKKSSKI